jgi:hypothetical protein
MVHPILLIQELQEIKLKHHNNNCINQVELMTYYVMTAINKRYSYPRVAVIRIDVHPTGKNPTNTPHVFYVW